MIFISNDVLSGLFNVLNIIRHRKEEPVREEPEKPAKNLIDVGKEAAIEAEVKAARERAVIPLEIRMKQFRDMLAEKEVTNITIPSRYMKITLCCPIYLNIWKENFVFILLM